jgi:hypothetical protein
MFHDISLDNEFLDMIQKAQAIIPKTEKWDYIKLKSLCTAKETTNKVKRQPRDPRLYLQTIHLIKGYWPTYTA